jgi:hypothetical protein
LTTVRNGHTHTHALISILNINDYKEETEIPTESIGEDKKQILYEDHDAPLGGYRGMNKMYKAIKSKFVREEVN